MPASFYPGGSAYHYYEVQFAEGTTYTIDFSLGTLLRSGVDLIAKGFVYETVVHNRVDEGSSLSFESTAQTSSSHFVSVIGFTKGSYTLTVTDSETARSSAPAQTTMPGISPKASPSATALTFAAVSAGGEHTCGFTTSGAAYCWGRPFSGELGDGANDRQLKPVAVSGVTTSGAAYCWGTSATRQGRHHQWRRRRAHRLGR